MIAGTLRLIERDETLLVVDENGDIVVCRGSSQRAGTGGNYHRIDAKHFGTTGEIKPACGDVAHYHDHDWLPKRKADLESHWTECSFAVCFGEYDPSDPDPKVSGQTGLAKALEAMSVEEFDAAVAEHQALQTDGGKH